MEQIAKRTTNKQEITRTYLQRALNIWGIVVIVWAFYRAYITFVPMGWEEFVIKPVVFLVPLFAFFHYSQAKHPLKELTLLTKRTREDMVYALWFAGIIFAIIMIGWGKFLHPLGEPKAVLWFTLTSFVTACTEEILLRGFLLNTLLREWNYQLSAVFVGSLLSVLIYIPVFFAQSSSFRGYEMLIALGIAFFVSLIASMLFTLRRSVWLPIAFHFVFLLAIGK